MSVIHVSPSGRPMPYARIMGRAEDTSRIVSVLVRAGTLGLTSGELSQRLDLPPERLALSLRRAVDSGEVYVEHHVGEPPRYVAV